MTPALRAVLDAAADNDLYRVCGTYNPASFRTAAGDYFRWWEVREAVARGLLGSLSDAGQLPDGTWAQRLDLSEHGLDRYLAEAGAR